MIMLLEIVCLKFTYHDPPKADWQIGRAISLSAFSCRFRTP